jgi:hypothetical protein
VSDKRWIPVSERLPPLKEKVVIWVPYYKEPAFATLSKGKRRPWLVEGCSSDGSEIYDEPLDYASHWMALPSPPDSVTLIERADCTASQKGFKS